jgi:hypothetical protein
MPAMPAMVPRAAAPAPIASPRAPRARPTVVAAAPLPAAPAARSPEVSPIVPVAPVVEDALVRESQVVAAAIERLRRHRDPAGALQLLARHGVEFPDGGLRAEATSVRIEALLAAQRRAEALALLDGLELEATPRGPALRVLRGELRASAGRCPEALADWAQAFDHLTGELRTRAQRGREHCVRARQ